MTLERLSQWGPMIKRCAASITLAIGGNPATGAG
jgi:hypothetical protein